MILQGILNVFVGKTFRIVMPINAFRVEGLYDLMAVASSSNKALPRFTKGLSPQDDRSIRSFPAKFLDHSLLGGVDPSNP